MRVNNERFARLLKTHNYSITTARQTVFEAFINSEPLSIAKLITKTPAIDRASIYRTVAIFEELGILNRLNFGWKYKLELSDLFSEHHHHATCTNCSKIVTFHETEQLEKNITTAGRSVGFQTFSHSLEIRGLCPDCQTI